MPPETSSNVTNRLLENVSHRPYALPKRPWAMTQVWNKLLFAHWPVRPDQIQALVPASLTVDTFEGTAWVGVVPFAMNDVCFRYLSVLPSNFCELNVRTYVSYKGRQGVFFFSLDASNPIAVEVARAAFRLSYFHSSMQITGTTDNVIYNSQRRDWRSKSVGFDATYHPIGPVQYSAKGSIEEFLTERYCFFTSDRGGRIMSCDVHHLRWPLQPVAAQIRLNTMLELLSLDLLKSEPLLYYSDRLETIEWLLESCD
jgi:uncharacterized protein YqjF (DUF2071 family)